MLQQNHYSPLEMGIRKENNGFVVTLTPIPLLNLIDQPDGDLLYNIDLLKILITV